MCRSGLCTSTPAGGAMSAAVTAPGPCLRRYMMTGSSCSEETTSSLMFRMMSVTSSLTPGDGGELVQDAVDADAGDRRAGDRRQQGATQRVAEGVAEAGLERLDDEPRAVLVDDLFGEGRALSDEQVCSSGSGRPLFDADGWGAPRGAGAGAPEAAAVVAAAPGTGLLRVELDDQLLLHLGVDDLRAPGSGCTRMRIRLGTTSSHAGTVRSPGLGAGHHERRQLDDCRRGPRRCRAADTRYDGMSTFLPLTVKWPWRDELAGHVARLRRSRRGRRRCPAGTRGCAAGSHRSCPAAVGLLVVAAELLLQHAVDARAFCFSRSCSRYSLSLVRPRPCCPGG